jgi:murein DD-endopeptidase MepM/ murein hydrolase activator NlpD
MKRKIQLLFVLIFQFVTYSQSFEQKISLDTSIRFLENTPFYSEQEALKEHEKIEQQIKTNQLSLKQSLYLIFRYRDDKFIPLWQNLLEQSPENDLLKIWFIDAICQIGNRKNITYMTPYLRSNNDIIRECAANAYGFLACVDSISSLHTLMSNEHNDYVKETLKASISAIKAGGYKNQSKYLPMYYDKSPKKIRFFYNQKVITSDKYRFGNYLKDDTSGCQTSSSLIYPTQQYISKIKYAPNAGSFANKHGPVYHVGFDGAWFFEGLPVHSISNGIIKQISHDLSWGNVIAVETCLPNSDTITIIYGHLSRFIPVSIGNKVYLGQRIGQIGNSVSYENGGYWAHLHVGIVKGHYDNFKISGYDSDTVNYENPINLILKWGKSGG